MYFYVKLFLMRVQTLIMICVSFGVTARIIDSMNAKVKGVNAKVDCVNAKVNSVNSKVKAQNTIR